MNLINQLYNMQESPRSSAQHSTDTFGNSGSSTPTSSRAAGRWPSFQAMSTREADEESDTYSRYSESEVEIDQTSLVMGRFGPSLTLVHEVPGMDVASHRPQSRILDLASAHSLGIQSSTDVAIRRSNAPRKYSAVKLRKESFYPEDHEKGSLYRRSRLCSDLADWAPSAKPSNEPWAGIKHLPDLNKIAPDEPTSKPIVDVQKDLEWSMQRLLNERAFEKLINHPAGRRAFRDYLVQQIPGSEHQLDMYFDLCQYVKQSDAICLASEGLYDIYLAQGSPDIVTVPKDIPNNLYIILKKHSELKASLAPMQQHLLQSLHKFEFQLFVKAQQDQAWQFR